MANPAFECSAFELTAFQNDCAVVVVIKKEGGGGPARRLTKRRRATIARRIESLQEIAAMPIPVRQKLGHEIEIIHRLLSDLDSIERLMEDQDRRILELLRTRYYRAIALADDDFIMLA